MKEIHRHGLQHLRVFAPLCILIFQLGDLVLSSPPHRLPMKITGITITFPKPSNPRMLQPHHLLEIEQFIHPISKILDVSPASLWISSQSFQPIT
jgi:hypothetical protein